MTICGRSGFLCRILIGSARKLDGDLTGTEHPVRNTGSGCPSRHAVELSVIRVLHDDAAAGRLHLPYPTRAVAACAREDHCDRARSYLACHRAEKCIDRQAGRVSRILVREQQLARGEDHLLLRWDDVYVVGLELGLIGSIGSLAFA